MSKPATSYSIYIQLFLGIALFGSATPLSKLVANAFPVFVAGGMRVLLAFLVLLPFIKVSGLKNYHGRDLWLLLGISLFGVLGFTAFMLYGMKMASGVTGSIIMSSTPAVTAILSIIFFKDKITWKKIFALILAIGGVLLLQLKTNSHSQEQQPWLGIILIFAAVCCEACYTLMGKALTKNYPPEEIAGLSALIAVIFFIPFCIWQYREVHLAKVSATDWLALAAYGLITMGLGSVLWYKGINQVEGSVAASFMGVMPVSALVLSYILLGESFQWLHLAGFALVFLGVLLMISVHRQMATQMKHR